MMRYKSAFHATNDEKAADEKCAKMDLIVDIIEILSKFKIEDLSMDTLLDILAKLEKRNGE